MLHQWHRCRTSSSVQTTNGSEAWLVQRFCSRWGLFQLPGIYVAGSAARQVLLGRAKQAEAKYVEVGVNTVPRRARLSHDVETIPYSPTSGDDDECTPWSSVEYFPTSVPERRGIGMVTTGTQTDGYGDIAAEADTAWRGQRRPATWPRHKPPHAEVVVADPVYNVYLFERCW